MQINNHSMTIAPVPSAGAVAIRSWIDAMMSILGQEEEERKPREKKGEKTARWLSDWLQL